MWDSRPGCGVPGRAPRPSPALPMILTAAPFYAPLFEIHENTVQWTCGSLFDFGQLVCATATGSHGTSSLWFKQPASETHQPEPTQAISSHVLLRNALQRQTKHDHLQNAESCVRMFKQHKWLQYATGTRNGPGDLLALTPSLTRLFRTRTRCF